MKTMTKILTASFFCICIFFACSSDDTNNKVPQDKAKPIDIRSGFDEKLKQDNNFAFDLLKTTNKYNNKPNLFISPLSVSMALNMTLNGANGETREEMLTALRVNGYNVDEINEYSKTLREALINIDPSSVFTMANSIWYKLNLSVKSNFIETNRTNYNAEIKEVDFLNPNTLKQINSWCAYNTNNKIPKVLDYIPGNAVMYLINAIYFKGIWKYEFDKKDTRKEIFTNSNQQKQEVQMMKQNSSLYYSADSNCQYLELPYGNEAFSMVLMLPHENRTTDDIIDNLNSKTWNSALSGMRERKINLELPRFKTEGNYGLHEKILPEMGMKRAFGADADFSNIADDMSLAISRIIHKTMVEVNEEGSEAAAVTVVEIFESTGIVKPEFKVNKPFLFAIKEKSTGVIIFIGKIGEIEQ